MPLVYNLSLNNNPNKIAGFSVNNKNIRIHRNPVQQLEHSTNKMDGETANAVHFIRFGDLSYLSG